MKSLYQDHFDIARETMNLHDADIYAQQKVREISTAQQFFTSNDLEASERDELNKWLDSLQGIRL